MAALSMLYTFLAGAKKVYPSFCAICSRVFLRRSFALTPPANIIELTQVFLAARLSFVARTITMECSNSKAISRRSAWLNTPRFLIFRASISRRTALLSQEKEKSKLSDSSNGMGKSQEKLPVYSLAYFATIGPPGKPSHMAFATLSKASPAASSRV